MTGRHYLALGDSFTYGVGDDLEGEHPMGWARRVKDLLVAQTGTPHAFTNLAVSKATISDVLRLQMPQVPQHARPDLASLSIGVNDAAAAAFSAEDFRSGVAQVLTVLRATGARTFALTLPDVSAVLQLPPELLALVLDRLEQINDAIRAASRATGVECFDGDEVGAAFRDLSLWSADRVHPSPRGHQFIAQAVLSRLSA